MGDGDDGDEPGAADRLRSNLSAEEVRAFADRAPRCTVSVVVLCTPAASATVIEGALVNVSSSGMFVASTKLFEVGTEVGFEFKLDDGVVALRGRADVVRRELRGMGLRFVNLDDTGRDLVARLIEAATSPERGSTNVEFGHGTVRIRLTPETAPYFTSNPLLHIGVGGCFLPAAGHIALGTGYELNVIDGDDRILLRCRAKVAATQVGQIGLRFVEADRAALQALRADIARESARTTGKAPAKIAPTS